jgi:hypothetical protein
MLTTLCTFFMPFVVCYIFTNIQMNWVKYLVNQLKLDCHKAQDQGYEFHFSWLLILITFVA